MGSNHQPIELQYNINDIFSQQSTAKRRKYRLGRSLLFSTSHIQLCFRFRERRRQFLIPQQALLQALIILLAVVFRSAIHGRASTLLLHQHCHQAHRPRLHRGFKRRACHYSLPHRGSKMQACHYSLNQHSRHHRSMTVKLKL